MTKNNTIDQERNTIIDAKEAIFAKISAENQELRDSLAEIYDIIQDNEKRQQHYNQVEDTIFSAESLDSLLHDFGRDLKEIFSIPIMAVALLSPFPAKSGLQAPTPAPSGNPDADNGMPPPPFATISDRLYKEFFSPPRPLIAASLPPELEEVFARCRRQKPEIASLVCVPLAVGQRHLGVLLLASDDQEKFTPEKGTDFICRLGTRLAVAIENLLIRRQLEAASRLDQLTGLHNRRALNELLPLEMARAKRYRLPLALMMIDLDDFKEINDTHGHVIGDAVLAKIGKILRENTRTSDTAVRYGGDEFLVIMPHTNGRQAVVVAEKILAKAADAELSLPDGNRLTASLTIGLGIFPRPGVDSEKELLETADQNLYRAKLAGKGQVGY